MYILRWSLMKRRFFRQIIPALLIGVMLGFMSRTLAVPRGVTRPWNQPGAPTGSYGLSGFESINLFTGKLNFSLPFLNIGGRDGVGTPLTLQIGRSWRNLPYTYTQIIPSMPAPSSSMTITSCVDIWDAETSTLYGDQLCNSFDVHTSYEIPPSQQVPQTVNTPVVMKDMLVGPGYGPGLLVARTAVSSVRSCFAYNTGSYNVSGSEAWITKTYLTFIAPDGTEYELLDTQTYGGPYENTNGTCNSTPHSRGTTFISSDGTGMTFISDAPINDDVRSVTPNQFFDNVGMPSGYLLMQDGSRYRVREGKIDWIRDRNGNLTTFTYGVQEGSSERKLISTTDSVGRVTTIEYNVNDEELSPDGVSYGTCDRITYHGFGGEQRTIRIVKKSLSETLRPNSGYALKTATEMWRLERPSATAASLVNPTDMVSVLWLPDGRKYRFYYNPFVELARVELPTGGAIDYDHDYGLTLTMDNGSVTHNANDLKFYRRLTERRIYTDKDDPSSLENTSNYGQIYEPRSLAAPTPTPGGVRTVTEEQKDKDGNRVSFVKHYFHGDPMNGNSVPLPEASSILLGVDWMAGREVQTDVLSNNGATVLRRAKYTWQPRVPEQGTKMNYRPPRDVVLVETKTFIEPDGANLVTKQGSVNPQTGEIGFDQYNNQTDAWDYAYGVGEAGPVVRHTRTDFMTVNSVNGVDYTSPNLTPTGVYMRGLTSRTSIYDANNVERSRTTFEYDNHAPDSVNNNRHDALVTYSNIFGLCTTFDPAGNCSNSSPASYTTRGNVTGVTRYLLDKDGNITGSVTSNQQYDVAGHVVKAVDARLLPGGGGYETTFDYSDNFGSPDAEARNNNPPPELGLLKKSYALAKSVTNALGQIAYTQYDYHTGRAVNFEDPNNQVSAFEYNDLLDRVTLSTPPPGGGQVINEYGDTIGNLFVKTKTQLDSNVWEDAFTYYDGLGRVTKTQSHDARGDIFSETVYDAMGRIKKTSGPHRADEPAQWVETIYDDLGRAKEVSSPKVGNEPTPAKVKSEYAVAVTGGQLGLVCIGGNQADKRARSITNALGQLIRVDEPDDAGNLGSIDSPNRPTYYQYDTLGNLIKVIQGSQTRAFLYDSLGRLIRVKQSEQEINPDLTLNDPQTGNSQWSTGLTYDENGNILTTTDSKGVVVSYEYDPLNRVVRKSYSVPAATDPKRVTSPTTTVTYKYDGALSPTPNNPNPGTVAFATGALTEVSNGVSTTQFTGFDNLGRVLSSKQIIDGQEYPFGYKYTLPGALNLSGALMEETYPSGRVVTNGFDSSGDLSSVSSHAPSQAAKVYASDLRYTADRSVDRIKLGNNRWETYQFNTRDQITQIGLGTSETDTSIWRVNYDYGRLNQDGVLDAAKNDGNVVRQTITVPGATSYVQSYSYDPLNRLVGARETVGDQQTWRQDFAYDRYGNRTGFSQISGQTQLALNNLNNPEIDASTNRIKAGQGYAYDLNGNLTQDAAGRKFDFDGDNKQSAVKDTNGNVIATYGYDGNGRRVKKTILATQEVTVFVYDASGKLAAEYSSVRPQNPTTRYITADILDTPRVITDNSGGVISRKDYMPFGEELFEARDANQRYGYDTGVRRGFTGYEKDDETQFNFAEARYYNPVHGRFTTVDPMLASGASTNPQSFNRYVYAGNNPTLRIDPNGEDWFISRRDKVYSDGTSGVKIEHFWSNQMKGLEGYEKVRSYIQQYNSGDHKGLYALDPWENRIVQVSSVKEGMKQLEAFKRQAALNFIVGALEASSLVLDLSGVLSPTGVERDSEQYKLGQKVGFVGSSLAAAGGVGLIDSIFNKAASKFGKRAVAAARELKVLQAACFVAGTPVHTSDGLKAIEKLRAGDRVLSWNERNKRFEYRTVVRTFTRETQRLVRLKVEGESGSIVATPEHPFYARLDRGRDWLGAGGDSSDAGAWVAAGELLPGDRLLRPDGTWAEVEGLEHEERAATVYNFEVEGNHNYFVGVGGVLVHNNCVDRAASVLGHIFRNSPGHINPGTIASRERFIRLFESVGSDAKNLRPDAVTAGIITQDAANAGVEAYTQVMRDGSQVWALVRNGIIFNAGVNPAGMVR